MIDRMMVGPEPLNTTLGWAVQNAVEDWERAAIYYLQNYGPVAEPGHTGCV